jgi:hypothetical protein
MIAKAMKLVTAKAVASFDGVHSQHPTTYEACVVNREQLSRELQDRLASIPKTDTRLHVIMRHHLSPEAVKQLDDLATKFAQAMSDLGTKAVKAISSPEPKAKDPGLRN